MDFENIKSFLWRLLEKIPRPNLDGIVNRIEDAGWNEMTLIQILWTAGIVCAILCVLVFISTRKLSSSLSISEAKYLVEKRRKQLKEPGKTLHQVQIMLEDLFAEIRSVEVPPNLVPAQQEAPMQEELIPNEEQQLAGEEISNVDTPAHDEVPIQAEPSVEEIPAEKIAPVAEITTETETVPVEEAAPAVKSACVEETPAETKISSEKETPAKVEIPRAGEAALSAQMPRIEAVPAAEAPQPKRVRRSLLTISISEEAQKLLELYSVAARSEDGWTVSNPEKAPI